MRKLTHGSLFSGIGGPDLAAEWLGWENVFHCEWNDFGKQILKYYWPKALSYDDITKTDFTIHRGKIDVLSGGFPCQPYSAAGKRKGKEDDRHLWPEMLRAIREIRPKWVVGENVLGLVNWNGGMVFDEVQADLEAEGYEVQPYVLPACAVNAPHRRDRVWFVAYANECTTGSSGTSGETESNGSKNNNEPKSGRKQTEQHFGCSDVHGIDTNTKSKPSERMQSEQREISKQEQRKHRGNSCGLGSRRDDSNTNDKRQQKCNNAGQPKEPQRFNGIFPPPENWENFPTQSPVCYGNDGFSARLDGITFPKWRNESIKAGGNAIVPQLIYHIFNSIKQYEDLYN